MLVLAVSFLPRWHSFSRERLWQSASLIVMLVVLLAKAVAVRECVVDSRMALVWVSAVGPFEAITNYMPSWASARS